MFDRNDNSAVWDDFHSYLDEVGVILCDMYFITLQKGLGFSCKGSYIKNQVEHWIV